jgi:PAS domain S-box-containing protein
MNGLLKILFLEDVLRDAELNWHEIERKGIRFERLLVDNRKDYLNGLKSFKPDIIISDYSLPQFDGMKALLLRNNITPLTPFIIVTGSVNEEVAVECMKAGADDYVIKEHLTRLPFAVKEALEKHRIQIEKRAAELLLKENEEKLQSIFSAAPVGIGLLVNNILLEVNDTFCEMTGYCRRELIGNSCEFIYATKEEYESTRLERFSQMSGGVLGTVETRFKCKNDKILNILLSSALLDKDDLTKGVTFTVMDITDSKRDLSELMKLRKAIDSSGEAIFLTDNDGIFSFINPGFSATYGYDPEEIVGRVTPRILKSGLMSENSYSMFWEKLIRGHEVKGELKNKRKDGTIIDVEGSANEILDENNTTIGFLGIQRDITERKKTEEALIKSEEKFRTIMENSADPIFITDSHGKYIYINKAVTVLLGYTSDEMLTKTIIDLTPPEKISEYIEIFKKILNEGKILTEIELLKKDGSFISTDLNSVLIPGGFVYGSCRDITERKQVEKELTKHRDHLRELVDERTEELNRAKKEAEAANRAKSDFLANMSHEIRTPMNAVLGYTELLNSTSLDQTQLEYIKSIISSGKSLLKLINDILDLSKVEAGKLELEYTYVDVYSFFYEFERIFSLKVSDKGLKLILEIAKGTPAGLYIDEARMRQIVLNLIGNAIKFTSEGIISLRIFTENPKIIVDSKEKSEERIDLIIEVKDTGIGISKELQEAVFEPFVQGRGYSHYGGTGLGLTISRRLAALMAGSISVQSDPGKGSTFTLRIPEIVYLKDFQKGSADTQVDTSKIEFEDSLILVADDVKSNRNFIRDALKNTRLKIVEAEDGEIAYKLAKEINPDLIIADIRMPKMDGFQLLNKIKKDKNLRHIPVFAYTASVLRGQKEQILKRKFVQLLIKPVNVTELYIALMKILPYKLSEVEAAGKLIPGAEQKGEITDLPGLINSLETDYYVTLKTFSVRQPIGEIRAFGKELTSLGIDHNSNLLTGYGKELIAAADSFNIEAILRLIRIYKSIIERLKEPAKYHGND